MEDYYKILSIDPQSNTEEISEAINAHYNQVRRLVNHYDPNIVNQANQALNILEQMKVTLLNPQKKAEYDLSLQKIGGLAEITTETVNNSGPSDFGIGSAHTNNVNATGYSSDGWTCPNCQRSNPKGALFCQYCQAAIGRICPNCQTHYESKATFCPHCGKSIEQAQKIQELTQEIQKRQKRQRDISHTTLENSFLDARYLEYMFAGSFGWSLFMGLLSILFTLVTLVKIVFSFIPVDSLQSNFSISFLRAISGLSSFLLWIIWAAVLGFFVYLIQKKGLKINIPGLVGYGMLSLIALIIKGGSLFQQVLWGVSNHWLIFPGIVAVILIGISGYLFYKNPVGITPPQINHPEYKKVEPYLKQIFSLYEKNVWVVTGIGSVLSLLVVFFSPSRWLLIGLITGLVSLIVSLLLLIIAFRINQTGENQKNKFDEIHKSEIQENNRLENEIAELKNQINQIG